MKKMSQSAFATARRKSILRVAEKETVIAIGIKRDCTLDRYKRPKACSIPRPFVRCVAHEAELELPFKQVWRMG